MKIGEPISVTMHISIQDDDEEMQEGTRKVDSAATQSYEEREQVAQDGEKEMETGTPTAQRTRSPQRPPSPRESRGQVHGAPRNPHQQNLYQVGSMVRSPAKGYMGGPAQQQDVADEGQESAETDKYKGLPISSKSKSRPAKQLLPDTGSGTVKFLETSVAESHTGF